MDSWELVSTDPLVCEEGFCKLTLMICSREKLGAEIVCAADEIIGLHLTDHPVRHLLTNLPQTLLNLPQSLCLLTLIGSIILIK